jgi:hypothetical protein
MDTDKKSYYELNKTRINLKRTQVSGCKVFNCAFLYNEKARHLRSKKHLKNLQIYKEKEYKLNPDLNKIVEIDNNEKYIFIT